MSIQAPPNLNPAALDRLLAAGIDDWGGISPVTPDHVNPEAPWPHARAAAARDRGRRQGAGRAACDLPALRAGAGALAGAGDAHGRARSRRRRGLRARGRLDRRRARQSRWRRRGGRRAAGRARSCRRILRRARDGRPLAEAEVVRLFAARGREVGAVCRARRRAAPRRSTASASATSSTATSTTPTSATSAAASARSPRAGSPSICAASPTISTSRRSRVAPAKPGSGAPPRCACRAASTPTTPAQTYLEICRTVKAGGAGDPRPRLLAARGVAGRAHARDRRSADFLAELKRAGLGSLPGTAAEILDDEVRRVICPDKITTAQWLEVMRARPRARAAQHRHRSCSATSTSRATGRGTCCASASCRPRPGGFTEFVPLPFVHMEAPIYPEGRRAQGADLARGPADARGRAPGRCTRTSPTSRPPGSRSGRAARRPAWRPGRTISAAR